jgi:hypothetical protein
MNKRKNKKILAETFQKKGCNISATCLALGISRPTFYRWLEEDKKLREKVEEVEEALIDNVESKLLKKITDEDMTAIIFYLKTKGKNRGYVERVEQEVSVSPFLDLMKRANRVTEE